MVAIALAHSVAYHGIVARAQTWWKLQVHRGIVHLVHLNRHNLLQLLYAALHLHSLGWLIAEPLYEVLDVGYFLLLVLVGTQLLFVAFVAQLYVFVVFHTIVVHLSAGDLYGAVCHIINKSAVVAHQHHGLGALLQESLQPSYTFDVEMVGRLVEQEYVGTAQQNLCQLDTHAPTARELARGTVEVCAQEAQTCQRTLYLGLIVVAAHHHEAVVLLRKLLHKCGIRFALVIGTLCQLAVKVVNTCLHLCHVRESLARLLLHGGVVLQNHHLWQVAYSGVVGYCHLAICRFLQSAYYLQHGRLACSVLAHKGYAVAVVHYKAHISEQWLCAELN